ncbi:hypothetical protein [Halobellus rarus]|uniref:DUF8151 domain-containing protein n=1 Tax=Halobellus rarus TaxID=1126237 RepID=A0ABD6CKZ0_9EURY|nr:hypothetical protein [Halobellus rarus]
MAAALLELLPMFLELFVFSLGAVGLSLTGAYVERFAVATAQHGQPLLALWAAVMGAVALYFAYSLAIGRVAPTLAELADHSSPPTE